MKIILRRAISNKVLAELLYSEIMQTDLTEETIIEVLKTVEDPELFLDIWFLGLVYDVRIEGSKVTIEMTFTTPLCPYGPQLAEEVKSKVEAIEGVSEARINVVFNPPWQPSDEVKGMLGYL